jgi:hypothetical protein
MTKRKPRPKKETVEELLLRSRDDLHALRMDVRRRLEIAKRRLYALNSRADSIREALRVKEQGCEIGVSDHALLRYLERYKGIDVPAIRRELSESIAERIRSDARKANGGVALMGRHGSNGVVATYITDEMVIPSPADPECSA